MEKEVVYSTVVFNKLATAPKEKKEDPTNGAEVKEVATSVPNDKAAACRHFGVLVACLGILCVLVVSISLNIYFCYVIKEQRANLSNLTAENELLIGEKTMLIGEKTMLIGENTMLIGEKTMLIGENTMLIGEKNMLIEEKSHLSRVADNLNRTLGVIRKFDTFRVKDFCSNEECQPCLQDWIQFQEKCYLFYDEPAYAWRAWQYSRKYCQKADADLVVIDNWQEQEFVSNHIEFYYDDIHGYWLGLNVNEDKDWVWVDGSTDTLGYWSKVTDFGNHGPCGLIIPILNHSANWDPAECGMRNKFICERDSLTWSF